MARTPDTLEAPPLAAGTASVPPTASGARNSAILAGASAASIVANYVFLLAAGRILGSDDYGSLAALLGVLAVVLIPAGALQMAVSREVSRRIAAGDLSGAEAFGTRTLRLAALATLPLVAVTLALAAPLAHILNIDSVGIVVLAESTFVTALVFPVAIGVVQGKQRFHALAAMYVVPILLRLVIFAVAAAAGYRLGGAVLASLVSSIVAAAIAVALAGGPRSPAKDVQLTPFLRYLGPTAVGLVGIALLTHVDILVVKARFSAHDAGAYAAASAFARVGFFLPATILTVLFPRTAARHARGEETEDILGRSLLATAAFSAALVVFYAAAGVGLVATTFGVDFSEGGHVLAPFALAIALFSVANILVGYHLSRGETRYAWIVAGGVVVQVILLALVPNSLHGVVWTNVAVGAALLVAHELLVGSSLPALRAGLRYAQPVLAGVRARAPEVGLVLLGTTAFVCALFAPVVAHFGSTIMGIPGSDSTGTIAGLWELRHEGGYHLLGITHHTLSGAPFGWDESNALNTQTFLPYYAAYLLAHVIGDVAAYNVIVLSGYVLSGAAMYLVTRYLGATRLVAAWAAMVYIVFPWHLARVEHGSLLHIEVLALLVLALVATVRQPTASRFALVAAINLAAWVTSGYFGPMAAVTTLAFGVGAALVTRGWGRTLRLLGGSVACVLVSAGLIGIAAVVSGTNSGAGLNRAAGDLSVYGLRPVELVVPPAQNIVVGDRLESFWGRHSHGSNPTEFTNYLGLLTFVLALGWLVVFFRRRRTLSTVQVLASAGLVAALVAGILFAAPSPVSIAGHQVWSPSRLLWEVVPAFRVPSRWDPLLMTVLLPLAALGLHALVRRYGKNVAVGSAIVAAAMVFSFFELAIHPARPRFRTVPVPAEYAAVERTPHGILAEYPLGYSDVYRLWQRQHGRPLLNGAPAGSTGDSARLVLLDPADRGTAAALAFLGVTAIGIHPGAHVDSEVDPRAPAGDAGYRLVGRFADGASVWQVVAAPAPALVTLPGGFAIPHRQADGSVGFALNSTAGVGVLELTARRDEVVRLQFDATPPSGKQIALRVTDPQHEAPFTVNGRTGVSVLVSVPRGVSQLLVKVDPAPTSDADAVVLSTPRAQHATGAPVLHAELVSNDPGL